MITIVLVVAHVGFQPLEYSIPKKILTQAGFNVITASTQPGTAQSSTGTLVKVDTTLDALSINDFDGIYFVGGPGALTDLDNSLSYTLLQATAAAHKPYGAICIAPRILAHAGILKNKKATGWDDDGELTGIFKRHHITYVHKPVVVDDIVITASGPAAAEEFGNQIVKLFKKISNKRKI